MNTIARIMPVDTSKISEYTAGQIIAGAGRIIAGGAAIQAGIEGKQLPLRSIQYPPPKDTLTLPGHRQATLSIDPNPNLSPYNPFVTVRISKTNGEPIKDITIDAAGTIESVTEGNTTTRGAMENWNHRPDLIETARALITRLSER